MKKALFALIMAAAPAAAQQPSNTVQAPAVATLTDGWRVRYDRAGVSDTSLKVEPMNPGFHVTTTMRGAGVMWKPEQTARGNFRVEAETHLFPTSSGHAEGYGLVVGGRDLEGANQGYLYFLVRADGQYLIKQRDGAQTRDIVPWTAHQAVARQEGTQSARQLLAVEAAADSVKFFVNGQQVRAVPRSQVQVDGQVGLRVNHASSVHVSRVAVQQR